MKDREIYYFKKPNQEYRAWTDKPCWFNPDGDNGRGAFVVGTTSWLSVSHEMSQEEFNKLKPLLTTSAPSPQTK